MSDRIGAIIPLRGGSKSIPKKNIKVIAGKPLYAWVVEAAICSELFDYIIVSSEDSEIKKEVTNRFKNIQFVDRPKELARDDSSTEEVVLHVLKYFPLDIIFTIQATSPLITGEDLRNAYDYFLDIKVDSLLTAVRLKRFFWNIDGNPINYNPRKRPRRQDFNGTLMENGAFYITKNNIFKSERNRIGGRIGIFEMPQETAGEIDEPADWNEIENMLLSKKMICNLNQKKMQYLFVDVDGTLTDGAMYYSMHGEELKRFNTRDGMGLRNLQEKGIKIGIITSEKSEIAKARARKLDLDFIFIGVEDKREKLLEFLKEKSIDQDTIGYIGDDLNDLEAIEICGFSACPSDSSNEIKQVVDYICSKKGGMGAVREFCDLIYRSIEENSKVK